MTIEQEATKADLLQALYFARNQYAEAERTKTTCERRLMEFLEEIGEKSIHSEQLHITATVTRRRTAKLANEKACAEALNEIGLVIPRKEVVDTSELLAIADRYGGDFPGVEVTVSESLRVTGDKR